VPDLGGLAVDRPEYTYEGPPTVRGSGELLSAMVPLLPRQAAVMDLG
jgi:hypothetical protein